MQIGFDFAVLKEKFLYIAHDAQFKDKTRFMSSDFSNLIYGNLMYRM